MRIVSSGCRIAKLETKPSAADVEICAACPARTKTCSEQRDVEFDGAIDLANDEGDGTDSTDRHEPVSIDRHSNSTLVLGHLLDGFRIDFHISRPPAAT